MSSPAEVVSEELLSLKELVLNARSLGFDARVATPHDLRLLEPLAGSNRWPTYALSAAIASPAANNSVLVLTDKNQAVGYVHYSLGDSLSIKQVAIDDAYQKKGLGLLLTYTAFKQAQEADVKEFSYDVEPDISGFYHKIDGIRLDFPGGFPKPEVWFSYPPPAREKFIKEFEEEEDDPLVTVSDSVDRVVAHLAAHFEKIPKRESESDLAREPDAAQTASNTA